jgi:hypothetical protein
MLNSSDELSVVPPIGSSTGTTVFSLATTPTLSSLQLGSLLTTPKVSLFYDPAQTMDANAGKVVYNLTSQIKTNAKVFSGSASNSQWDIEFVVVDTVETVTQKYPISQPFTVFG